MKKDIFVQSPSLSSQDDDSIDGDFKEALKGDWEYVCVIHDARAREGSYTAWETVLILFLGNGGRSTVQIIMKDVNIWFDVLYHLS